MYCSRKRPVAFLIFQTLSAKGRELVKSRGQITNTVFLTFLTIRQDAFQNRNKFYYTVFRENFLGSSLFSEDSKSLRNTQQVLKIVAVLWTSQVSNRCFAEPNFLVDWAAIMNFF